MADMWRVTAQRQSEELVPGGGGFQSMWTITFQITDGPATGSTGTVKIPASQYSAANVQDKINTQVSAMSAVAAL